MGGHKERGGETEGAAAVEKRSLMVCAEREPNRARGDGRRPVLGEWHRRNAKAQGGEVAVKWRVEVGTVEREHGATPARPTATMNSENGDAEPPPACAVSVLSGLGEPASAAQPRRENLHTPVTRAGLVHSSHTHAAHRGAQRVARSTRLSGVGHSAGRVERWISVVTMAQSACGPRGHPPCARGAGHGTRH